MVALVAWTPEDGVLGAVAPLGLAAARGTALVVDLDPGGPRYPGEMTLARLVAEGPRRRDLEPAHRGVAVLGNGGISAEAAIEVVAALVASWPDVVLRVPAAGPPPLASMGEVPVVAFRPLLPGGLAAGPVRGVVWQSAGWRLTPPSPGPVLPRARAATVHSLLSGVRPRRDRWLRAIGEVWSRRWR